MGFLKIGLMSACVCFASCALYPEEEINPSHVLYLMQSKEVEKSLHCYKILAKKNGHNFELLQKMASLLLSQGAQSTDPEIEQLTIFGAGLSASSHSLPILEKGLSSTNIQTSLMALHFLSLFQDDRSDELIEKVLSSDFLMTRLEALYVMAQKKHPHAIGQIESLMHRLPLEIKPIFPSLFALVGTRGTTPILKELLNDPNPYVRIEALLSVGRFERDDLLAVVRQKGSHPSLAEKEALSMILGSLKDSASIPLLKTLAKSPMENVQIAAAYSLFLLGEPEGGSLLTQKAQNKNPFAISLLSALPKSEDLLVTLMKDEDLDVRINATLALLEKRDQRAGQGLKDLLLLDKKNFLIMPLSSPGRSMQAWRVVSTPSFYPKKEEDAMLWEVSLNIKEFFLKKALDLPEKCFLSLAEALFDAQINELIPALVHALENLRTPEAILLLKKQIQRPGSPLIRDYANLTLFRLKEEGPYEESIYEWVARRGGAQLIRLRPYIPMKKRFDSVYSLSPEETSRLLIETYSALAESRKEKSIALLLEVIQRGNHKNRFALAGLLLRATE
jgi:HEAT repeat protein